MAGSPPVRIASRALVQAGANPITAFYEDTAEGLIAGRLYESTKEALLQKHPWRFAREIIQVTMLAAVPATKWLAQYQLPVDLLALKSVSVNGTDTSAFEKLGKKIYMDTTVDDNVFVEYTRNVPESEFSADFEHYLELELAGKFATALTRKPDLATVLFQQAAQAMTDAQNSDGQSSATQSVRLNRFLATRR